MRTRNGRAVMHTLRGQVQIHVDCPCHESLSPVGIDIRPDPYDLADHRLTCRGHHFGAQTASVEEEEGAPGWVRAYESAVHTGFACSGNGQETVGLVQ